MIYSASRRTDLPAFYPEWICEKVRRSRKLDAIVLWTKDPRNCLVHNGLRAVIQRVPTVIQFTLTGLGGRVWEPTVPAPKQLREALQGLTEILPQGALRWRFDPIVVTPDLDERFCKMLALLQECGHPQEEIVVSFPDFYAKVRRRLARKKMVLPELALEKKRELLTALHGISGLPLALCCEPELLDVPGTTQAHCIDGHLFDGLYGTTLGDLPRDTGQRASCGCMRSTDIGSYEQTCHHNCLYCYARPAED